MGEDCPSAVRKETYSSKLVLKDVVSGSRNVTEPHRSPQIKYPTHEVGCFILEISIGSFGNPPGNLIRSPEEILKRQEENKVTAHGAPDILTGGKNHSSLLYLQSQVVDSLSCTIHTFRGVSL